VKGLFLGALLVTAVAGGVAGLAIVAAPWRRDTVLDGYLILVGAIALITLLRATRAAQPGTERSAFERALRRRPPPEEPLPELARLEREVVLASTTAFDLHYRLRLTLLEIARHRLSTRRGIDLDSEPERAGRALGERAWSVLDPEREPPRDRLAPGLSRTELRALVELLERI
jgi:hypothetical protein